MTTATDYKIDQYHGNKTKHVPEWAEHALENLLRVLNESHLVEAYNIENVMLWNVDISFLVAKFDLIDCIDFDIMKKLKSVGWTFYWFQSLLDGYTLQFKCLHRGD